MSPYLKGGRDTASYPTGPLHRHPPRCGGAQGEQDQPATKSSRLIFSASSVASRCGGSCAIRVTNTSKSHHATRQCLHPPGAGGLCGAHEPDGELLNYVSHRPGVQLDGEHGSVMPKWGVRNLSQAVRRWRRPAACGRRWCHPPGGRGAAGLQRRSELAGAGVRLRAGDRQGYKIPLEHLRWYAAFHRKEDSVHIPHGGVLLRSQEGYLTKQGIRQVKSAFGRRIFQQDLPTSMSRKQSTGTPGPGCGARHGGADRPDGAWPVPQ